MSTENLCLHNKFGFCKHGNYCWKRHVEEKCENLECEGSHCERRHPQECIYFKNYKRCKFDEYCAYSHVVAADPVLEELKLVKEKLKVV